MTTGATWAVTSMGSHSRGPSRDGIDVAVNGSHDDANNDGAPAPSGPHLVKEPLTIAFTGALAYAFRSARRVFISHVEAFEELIPYVFMGEVAQWARKAYTKDPRDPELAACLRFIDSGLADHRDELDNMISVSFLEMLPVWTPEGRGWWELLPAHLRAELRLMRLAGGSTDVPE